MNPLARRWALRAGVLVLVVPLTAASCSVAASGPAVSGTNLTIYLSDPASLGGDQAAQDVVDAEKLAFSQLKGSVSGFQPSLGGPLSSNKVSSNARAAIDDSTAIAYLGELVPGTSTDSVGITNAEDLLQVSPTDSTPDLTQPTNGIPASHYYESWSTYGHTFARMVPTISHEAKALVAEMQSLHVKTLEVQTDGSHYGRLLSAAVTGLESAASISAGTSNADALLYAGDSRPDAATRLDSAAASNPHAKLFVPSALADPSFLSTLSPAAQKTLLAIVPGATPSSLGPAAAKFASQFRSTYGHAPSPEAIFGYAAMQAVLHVLAQAGSKANDRSTVVKDFMKLRYASTASPPPVLGSYSISYGDTSFDSFLIEQLKAGRLVTVKARQG